MPVRKAIDDLAGRICEAVIPVKHDHFVGKGREVAVCTLSSIDLLEEISKSDVMDRVALAGRLLSENQGIDAIVKFAASHPALKKIVLCGKEVKGHMAGQALLSLNRNGTDRAGRIIGARGPYPVLESPSDQIDAFRRQVAIVDMVGTTDLATVRRSVS
jgi:tetrahydromethanopterin S-methyltransferase subunit A